MNLLFSLTCGPKPSLITQIFSYYNGKQRK